MWYDTQNPKKYSESRMIFQKSGNILARPKTKVFTSLHFDRKIQKIFREIDGKIQKKTLEIWKN